MGAYKDAVLALSPWVYYPLDDPYDTSDGFSNGIARQDGGTAQYGNTSHVGLAIPGAPGIIPSEEGATSAKFGPWNGLKDARVDISGFPAPASSPTGVTWLFRLKLNSLVNQILMQDGWPAVGTQAMHHGANWSINILDGRLQALIKFGSSFWSINGPAAQLVVGEEYTVALRLKTGGQNSTSFWLNGVSAGEVLTNSSVMGRTNWRVGKYQASSTPKAGPDAWMQGVALFPSALTDQQLQNLHTAAITIPVTVDGFGTADGMQVDMPAGVATEPVYGQGSVQALTLADPAGAATEPAYAAGDAAALVLSAPPATDVQREPYRFGVAQPLALGGPAGYPRITKPVELFIEDSALDRAPTAVVATVENSSPGATLTFSVDSVPAYTAAADSTGALGRTSVPVASSHAAGPHVLSVSDGTTSAEATFTLARDGTTPARVVAADAPAALVPDAEGRWVLQDALPGGLGSWVMDPNPTTWSGPLYELDAEPSTPTSVGGRSRISGGNQKTLEWSLEGYCPDETFYNQLGAYAALNRRLWVIDHRGRAWKCAITDLQLEPRKRQRTTEGFNDWAHDYSLSLAVLDPDWSEPS